jgi:hypothetical protein
VLKKYCLLVLLLLLNSFNCYASFWDDVGECITNPCNCGQGTRNETWPIGSSENKKYDRNTLCAPWNKEDGRNNTCLLQFPYPPSIDPSSVFKGDTENLANAGYYAHYCAEKTLNSSYFNPKILVRTQTCNAVACWTLSTTLNWNGECMVWPGPYGLPLKRICARVALPVTPANPLVPGSTEIPQDPGYTPGEHLDLDGSTKPDKQVYGVDGQVIKFNPPKLCAYSDPGLVNIISDTGPHRDPLDWNPVHQPLHKTNELHPLTKVLIFFIDHSGTKQISSMVDMLLDALGGSVKGLDVFKSIFDFIAIIFNGPAETAKIMLKFFGTLNGSVDDYPFGCVEIPIGPYPPPYCNPLSAVPPAATVQPICKIDPKNDGITRVQSTTDSPCVNSVFDNNFISNSIRISLDNFIPICSNGENPKTNKCVLFNKIDLNSASTFHTNSAFTDLIKPCSSNGSCTGDIPCVCTKLTTTNCTDGTTGSNEMYNCGAGFRVVYPSALPSSKSFIPKPSNYFFNDLKDCKSTSDTSCQKIWGINTGSFIDVNLTFPEAEQNPATGELATAPLTIKDSLGDERKFTVSIVRKSTPKNNSDDTTDEINTLTQEPNQICAFEAISSSQQIIVGCEERDPPTKPILLECSSDRKPAGLYCSNNSYYTPQFIAVMRAGTNSTGVVVEPCSVHNNKCVDNSDGSKPKPLKTTVNLAGYNFTSFVTDDNYATKPFSGSRSINPSSIYGYYKKYGPYLPDGSLNPNAIYLNGLEYFNDRYIQGGTHACLQPESLLHCPSDKTNCVLTNLLNRDLIDCKIFANKAGRYSNLGLCTSSSSTSCQKVDSISGQDGGITINQCNNGIYCYTNTANKEVCKPSMNKNDRFVTIDGKLTHVDPSADQLNAYYDLNSSYSTLKDLANNDKSDEPSSSFDSSDPFDESLYGLRDKTAIELGLCVSIPQPVCPAITNPGFADGNATWPETTVGTEASGKCIPGYIPINPSTPLKRYCLSNAEQQKVAFEPLDSQVGCKHAEITLVKKIHNLPAPYKFNEYDGGIELGNYNPISISQNVYSSNLVFNIPDVTNVEYFRIRSIGYDDYVLVHVNLQRVYSGTGNHGPKYFAKFEDYMYRDDTYNFWHDDVGVDLMPYLQNGNNTIQIDLIVIGGGGLYYKIEYKSKN